MTAILYGIYILVCFFLIAVVLLQSGKGADLASAFGGGGSQAAIGARGAATALSRLTTYAAIGFMVLSLVLSIMKSRDISVLQSVGDDAPAATEPAPTVPSQTPAEEAAQPALDPGPAPQATDEATAAEEPASTEAGSGAEGAASPADEPGMGDAPAATEPGASSAEEAPAATTAEDEAAEPDASTE